MNLDSIRETYAVQIFNAAMERIIPLFYSEDPSFRPDYEHTAGPDQFALIATNSHYRGKRLQGSVLFNKAPSARAQVALYNHVNQSSDFQLGVLNFTGFSPKCQIGLVNFLGYPRLGEFSVQLGALNLGFMDSGSRSGMAFLGLGPVVYWDGVPFGVIDPISSVRMLWSGNTPIGQLWDRLMVEEKQTTEEMQ